MGNPSFVYATQPAKPAQPAAVKVQEQMNKHHKRKSMLKSNINITAAPVAYVAPVTGAVPVAGAASNYPAVAAAYQSQQPQQPQQASQTASAKQLLPILFYNNAVPANKTVDGKHAVQTQHYSKNKASSASSSQSMTLLPAATSNTSDVIDNSTLSKVGVTIDLSKKKPKKEKSSESSGESEEASGEEQSNTSGEGSASGEKEEEEEEDTTADEKKEDKTNKAVGEKHGSDKNAGKSKDKDAEQSKDKETEKTKETDKSKAKDSEKSKSKDNNSNSDASSKEEKTNLQKMKNQKKSQMTVN